MQEDSIKSTEAIEWIRTAADRLRYQGRDALFDQAVAILSKPKLTWAADEVIFQVSNIFEAFVVGLLLIRLPSVLENCQKLNTVLRLSMGALLELGDYEACLQLADICIVFLSQSATHNHDNFLSIKLSQAKAHRNLGRFQDALKYYREALTLASELKQEGDLAKILLLIGKVHGNYLGQQSLFHSFVEEAKNRLELAMQVPRPASERKQCIRTLAICHDALGQACRDSEPASAKYHFREALRLNRQLKRRNGVCRTECHLTYLEYQGAPSRKKPSILLRFQALLETLLDDPNEERGLGVRWMQYASMLADQGRLTEALGCVRFSEDIALRYSDHRTLARSLLLRAEMIATSDSTESIKVLHQAFALARKHNLLLMESRIHLLIARLVGERHELRGEIRTLVSQNREIFLRLLKEVGAQLQRFSGGTFLDPEIQLLSEGTRHKFYQRILLDFDQILAQLDGNARTLTAALQASDSRQQELLVFGVTNCIARELLHTAKDLLVDDGNPLSAISRNLGLTAERIRGLGDLATGQKQELETIAEQLLRDASSLSSKGKLLSDLRTMLSRGLGRPREFNQEVRLSQCCLRACSELTTHRSISLSLIRTSFQSEIIVSSNAELITSVIRNLLINAFEGAPQQNKTPRLIELGLLVKRSGDPKVNNPSRDAFLSIISEYEDVPQAEIAATSLRAGLSGSFSTKEFGSGVGLEMTRLVFEFFLGCELSIIHDGARVGLQMNFRLGAGKAKLADLRTE